MENCSLSKETPGFLTEKLFGNCHANKLGRSKQKPTAIIINESPSNMRPLSLPRRANGPEKPIGQKKKTGKENGKKFEL